MVIGEPEPGVGMNKGKIGAAKYTHGGDIYRNDVVLDFSVNVNPLGPPAAVVSLFRDLSQITKLITSYPDPECASLRNAIASHDGLSRDMIICTNGAAEFLSCLTKAIFPKKGLILAPAFSEYERCLEAVQAECIFADNEDSFIKAIEKVDMAFLCNPVNPTGVLLDSSFMKAALDTAEKNSTYLVIDESFLRFLKDFDRLTFRHITYDHKKLVIVDSFTKIFNIPGLRLGFGITSDLWLLNRMKAMLPTWNVSTISQQAGIIALGDGQYILDTITFLEEERRRLFGLLEGMGFKVIHGVADFIFFESHIELFHPLLSAGILIRDCGNYHGIDNGAYHYRIAIKKRHENDQLMTNIRKIVVTI